MRAGPERPGGERVTVEFQQRSVPSSAGPPSTATEALHLQALVDHMGGDLERAEVTLGGAARGRHLEFRRNGGDGYAYSVDDGRGWGRFRGKPRLFDLADFTAALDGIAVEDVVFETVPAERWSGAGEELPAGDPALVAPSPVAQALDVILNRAAFTRLLRIFAADLDEEDALALAGFSVSIAAAEDVLLACWWSLRGPAGPSGSPPEGSEPAPLNVTCSVVVDVVPISAPPAEELVFDASLPLVGRVDEVWDLLRRS